MRLPIMAVFCQELWLPAPLEEVFDFFSKAENLEAITPPWIQFRMETPSPIVMEEGRLIDYRLRVHGIPLRWRSLIEVWEPPFRFVDRQLKGPYRKWVHEHRFTEKDGGTLAEDHVTYEVPGGWLVDRLFVRRDIERIFQHRSESLRRRFDHPAPATVSAGKEDLAAAR